jgi:hypothetical protein
MSRKNKSLNFSSPRHVAKFVRFVFFVCTYNPWTKNNKQQNYKQQKPPQKKPHP